MVRIVNSAATLDNFNYFLITLLRNFIEEQVIYFVYWIKFYEQNGAISGT